MSEHVLDWIGAYYDGELHGERLHSVDAHLATCPDCRTALQALPGLSAWLQTSPPAATRTSPEQFMAQVGLRLGRTPPRDRERLRQATGLWLPLGIVALWALAQAVLAVMGGALLVWWGLRPELATDILAEPALAVIDLILLNAALTVTAAGLVWGCLAAWWAARDRQAGANQMLAGQQAG
jgi:predicted anti-sigma-YlaC factor YlaD